MTSSSAPHTTGATLDGPVTPGLLPGLTLAAVAAAAAWGAGTLSPVASPLLVAIVLGVVLANTLGTPDAAQPGLAVAGRRLLRLGIVLLGLQVSLSEVMGLGAGMLVVVVTVVVGGLITAETLGRALGVRPAQRTLIGAGFSICGAAAVAGVSGVVPDQEDEDVATAVALVVLFGTLMIPVIPVLGAALELGAHDTGRWAGASVHEVAQVVAVGGVVGPAALTAAVVVKLARVLMLAPVVLWLGVRARRSGTGTTGRTAPLVPAFVIGFVLATVVRSTGVVPPPVLEAAKTTEVLLFAAAMFALGCGVRFARLRDVGGRPFLLAAATTLVVTLIGLGGVTLLG